MSKRLEMLEKMVKAGGADAFAHYGLAMEYRREKRYEDALSAFDALRTAHADYVPAYLMAGQLLIELDRNVDAKPWLEQGRVAARKKGDSKALGEIEGLLAEISD